MSSPGSMTAAVWMAPMVPKLPLPIAQRIQRLLAARPGAQTQSHALVLCEAIVAYAACMRASVAAAVVPASGRSALAAGIAEFRRIVEHGAATIASYRDLLLAAAEVIEQIEPGHPLGRSELTRPRTAWVARMQLIEALGGEVSDTIKARAVDGGLVGILDLWVRLVELRRDVEAAPEGEPWLAPLGDLIVDTLDSSLLGDASLSYPEQAGDGSLGDLRRLHGLESDPDPAPAEADACELGVVCWRFDARVVSSCGLLSYWVDEHDAEHVGVLVKQVSTPEYLDFGSGKRSPPTQAASVDWERLHLGAVAVARERSTVPVVAIVAGFVTALLLIAGISWVVWPKGEGEGQSVASGQVQLASKAAKQSEPAEPEPVAEIIVEGEAGRRGARPSYGTRRADGGELAMPQPELEAPTAGVWFESERNLGTCQVSYEGRTRTANLHLRTRAHEGKLSFSYRCGRYRGRGSIDVKRNRVNGVLFCKRRGSVRVKTVRSNEGRCDR